MFVATISVIRADKSLKGQSWQAVFAFALIGCIFLLWIIIMAIQVFYDDA